jgi:hypothetical protein
MEDLICALAKSLQQHGQYDDFVQHVRVADWLKATRTIVAGCAGGRAIRRWGKPADDDEGPKYMFGDPPSERGAFGWWIPKQILGALAVVRGFSPSADGPSSRTFDHDASGGDEGGAPGQDLEDRAGSTKVGELVSFWGPRLQLRLRFQLCSQADGSSEQPQL